MLHEDEMRLEGEAEEVGVVDFGATLLVEGLGGFAAVTGDYA